MPLSRFNVDDSPIKEANNENNPIADLSLSLDRKSFSDEENKTYFNKDTHTEVKFSLKKDPFPVESITVKNELDDLENRKTESEVDRDLDQKSTIKSEEENFINNQYFLGNEEVDIKSEDDGEQSAIQFKNHKGRHTLKGQIKIHKCPDCPYQSNRKDNVKQHSIRHRKSDEIVWHRCTECPYKTAWKKTLKLHAIGHSETEQSEIFKCAHCDYESPKKQNLKLHLQMHRGKTMSQIHCPEPKCPYKTHNKTRLKRHSLVHINDNVFKCTQYPFQAKCRKFLNSHQPRDESTDRWHACAQCPFRTMTKYNLKDHVVRIHVNPEQLEWFMCEKCQYKTNRKYSLERHLLTHIKWWRCTYCSYETLEKRNFKLHQMRHQDDDDPSWHKCSECPYKTLDKSHLLRHSKNHKAVDQTDWVQCLECSYRTSRTSTLKAHQMLHTAVVERFRCFNCPYKTNWKRSLVFHMKIHLQTKTNKNKPLNDVKVNA